MHRAIQRILVAAAAGAALTASAEATTQEFTLEIGRKPLSSVLKQFSEQTGLQISYLANATDPSDRLVGPLSGRYTIDSALGELAAQGDLTFTRVNAVAVAITERRVPKLRAASLATESPVLGFAATESSNQPASRRTNQNAEKQPFVEEVIVTAQKRAESVQDVPISIAVLSGETLDSRGINDLKDLSYSVPGIYVQQGSYERRVSIRGIGNVFGSSSTIGTYVDEAVAVGPRGDQQLDLQAYDLARVEVLRGPQGTLYGQGSMGGTIRYITADPDLSRVTGTSDVAASFTQDGDPTERLRGVLSVPLVRDKLGVRVAGVYEDAGGWVDQPTLEKENINDRELVNVRTKALWRPTDTLDVSAKFIVHRDDRGASGNGVDGDGNYQQSLLQPATPSASIDYDLYNLTVAYDLPSTQLLSTSTYLDFDSELRNRGHECCSPTPHIDGQWTADREVLAATTFTQEIRLISSGEGSWKWTVGGFYQDSDFSDDWGPASSNRIGVPGGTVGVDIFNFTIYSSEESKSRAVFGETSYALTQRFNVGAGLRYFEDDRRLQTTAGGPVQSGTFHSTNPRVFLDYKIAEGINFYSSVAKGFRSGGFNAAGAPAYEPEELWSYELGTKMSLLERHLNLELALTRSDYSEYQIVGQIPSYIGNITSNAGEARIYAVDGLLAWRVTGDLELGATGSYIDADFTEINATNSSHRVGDPIDMVPEYGMSLWTEYQFEWSGDGAYPGFARLDYNQQGIAHFRNRSFASNYHSTSDVIGLLNARLGWANDRWTAELYAHNILNENGFDHPAVIERVATRAWPRSYGLQVGIRFN